MTEEEWHSIQVGGRSSSPGIWSR